MVADLSAGRRLGGVVGLLLALSSLSGCGVWERQVAPSSGPPTIAPVFRPTPDAGEPALATARPAGSPSVPEPSDAVIASRLGNDLRRVPVFDNDLAADWSLEQSTGLGYDLASRVYVRSQPYGIEANPQHGAARLFFTVRPDTRQAYQREQIVGVSIMINGGPDGIGEEDLLFTVLGSNAYPYWRANDPSVQAAGRITDQGTIFDEQRLYFLGFESGIPPNTWAEVIIWLDERILDPEYDYLTGIYILTDELFVKPFYIDEVNLLIADT